MKHHLYTAIIFLAALASAQEPATIRIKRESALVKAVFDNTQMTLMAIDRFGNPRENKIVSFKLYVKGKRETKEFTGYSNSLTGEMVSHLNKQPRAVKIFFTEITVRDENEHLLRLPDLVETWFPDCGNCEKGKGKRRDERP